MPDASTSVWARPGDRGPAPAGPVGHEPGRSSNPLYRAADLLERRGWCRGSFRDPEGRVCLDFALLVGGREHNAEARCYVETELRARGRGDGIVVWNDRQARDRHEVIGLLRAAARRWDADHAGGAGRPSFSS